MLHSNAKTEDPLFQTSDPSLLEMWDEIQTLQADFAVNQELPSYYRSPHWQSAATNVAIASSAGQLALHSHASSLPAKSATTQQVSLLLQQVLLSLQQVSLPVESSLAQHCLLPLQPVSDSESNFAVTWINLVVVD